MHKIKTDSGLIRHHFTTEQATKIRRAYWSKGKFMKELAREHGVTKYTIRGILRRVTYIEGPFVPDEPQTDGEWNQWLEHMRSLSGTYGKQD